MQRRPILFILLAAAMAFMTGAQALQLPVDTSDVDDVVDDITGSGSSDAGSGTDAGDDPEGDAVTVIYEDPEDDAAASGDGASDAGSGSDVASGGDSTDSDAAMDDESKESPASGLLVVLAGLLGAVALRRH